MRSIIARRPECPRALGGRKLTSGIAERVTASGIAERVTTSGIAECVTASGIAKRVESEPRLAFRDATARRQRPESSLWLASDSRRVDVELVDEEAPKVGPFFDLFARRLARAVSGFGVDAD